MNRIFLLLALCTTVNAKEVHHVFTLQPVKIELKTNHRTLIQFDRSVRVKAPESLPVEWVNANGVLYVTPTDDFPETLIRIQLKEPEQLILVDLSAKGKAPKNTHFVHLDEKETKKEQQKAASLSWIDMTRFAAKHFFGPERLNKPVPGILSVPVAQHPIRLFDGVNIIATPKASWRAGQRYITAVFLYNDSGETWVFNPYQLIGDYEWVTPQHWTLTYEHPPNNTTMMYIITTTPFSK